MKSISTDLIEKCSDILGPCAFDAEAEFPDDLKRIKQALNAAGLDCSDATISTIWEEVSQSDGAGWIGTSDLSDAIILERITSIVSIWASAPQ